MGALLDIIAPVCLLIAMGYIAGRRGWVQEGGFRGLNAFCFGLAAPALLFAGGTSGQGGAGRAAFAFFTGSLILYAGALWIARRHLRQPLGEASLFALNASFGNTAMMGLPIIAAAYGPPGLAILGGILALHAMVLLGLATIIAEIGFHAHAPWRRVLGATLAGVVRNPIVMAVFAGLVVAALGIPLPVMLRRLLDVLGGAAPPVALFVLGGGLAGYGLAAGITETLLLVVLKLVAMPIIVAGCAILFGLTPFETAVAVTTAALPTGANAFLLARRYGAGAERAGATVLASTLLSIASLMAALAFFVR